MRPPITDDQIEHYRRDGFLVLADFVDADACASLRVAAERIIDEFDPESHRTVFTTDEQERVSDERFLESGSGISCFFEEEAFDDAGRLYTDKRLSINKIGHALHDLDPAFEAFTYTPELAALASALGLERALALQSMYIFKQPLIGGEVACHQDATFLYTDPVTVTGFWFALEDATLHNGCLWAAPGGHRPGCGGELRKVFARAGQTDRDGTAFEVLDHTPLPEPAQLVPLEVEAGTLIVLHGLLPHWSDVNRSAESRHAYSVHCIDQRATYPSWNWLQRSADLPLRCLQDVAVAAS
jgi:phytanoyl-CoA hydroxylase